MNINELYNTYYSLESYINELESQLVIDLALEGYSYEDIATESIGNKIKGAFAKIRKGNKSEGKRELKEVTDELKEEEANAETPEEKKRLSTKKKVVIAAAIAAMTATAIALAKSKNKKDKQKAEVIQKQVKAVSKIVSNKAPHVKAVSKTVSNKAPEEIKTNDVIKVVVTADNIIENSNKTESNNTHNQFNDTVNDVKKDIYESKKNINQRHNAFREYMSSSFSDIDKNSKETDRLYNEMVAQNKSSSQKKEKDFSKESDQISKDLDDLLKAFK